MIIDRKKAPEFRAIDNINLIKPVKQKLDNGCNVFSFNSGDQDLVRIEWIFGNQRFDEKKPLLNVAVNTMLTDGTSTLTAAQIADKVDFYGAFLQVDYGYDNSQVVLYSLNKHLQHTLPVIKDILTDSVFPEKELETFIRNQQQKLQVSMQKNDFVARRGFNKALYGDTLYGLGAENDTYKTLRREDMLLFFKQMYQPSNCTIIVAGKIEPGILELITDTFDKKWVNSSEKSDTSQPELKPSAEHFYFIEKPDALQSAIRMGIPAINRNHPDFAALQVLNTILGGYFGSRLMANIREDKGYTYGIGSGMSALKHGGALFIATEVGADVCKAAVNEIEKELNLLQTELITEEELSLVRNFLLGSLLGSLENVFSHADKFKNLYFAGLDYDYYDYYDRYVETVKTVTAGHLQELAKQYLNFNQFYKVIVGKY
ncbi:putative Zn-dependent peptidase [Mucilaginibacter frigoritolerans]|uniref:Putative Zn-dependent peptidase n=1 Tax=Mucilaginibacter frigoritolerans TaxID=652788 RepID=A0A562U4S0_9SPHI|nr:pitrilysin family protein [Mucilaginibacter frigoritolerans]TWJ00704.1 putative Zn-dependent peptidase [Mucilaginibacter frigoritolerans]